MPKAKKLPSGMWRCQASVDGERRSFMAWTKKEAEFLALKWQREAKDQKQKGMTIGEAGERYIATRDSVQSPKTIRENKAILRNLPDKILNMPVSDIDQEIIQVWVNELSGYLAPKTVRNRYGFIAATIHCYSPESRFKIDLPRVDDPDIYIPTHAEVGHIISVLHGKDADLEAATIIAASNGLRRSEICGLNNFPKNFVKRKIDIFHALVEDENGNLVLKPPKTKNSKRVLIAPQYVADRLLETPKGWEFIVKTLPHNITQRFETVVKHEFDHSFTFHDLRHYYASVLLAQGVPERYAMKLMGHSTPDMLRKVYGHIMADKEDEVTRDINRFFENNFAEYSHENAHD